MTVGARSGLHFCPNYIAVLKTTKKVEHFTDLMDVRLVIIRECGAL
jgi:hypothetical protein